MRLAAVDWGSVPDWIAGIGSVFATLLAVSGLLYEMHKRRLTEARAAAERRAAEANQARLVSVQARVRGDGHRAELILRNDSAAPIRTVTPVLYWADTDGTWRIPRLSSNGSPQAVLGPHESATSFAEVAFGEPGPPEPAAVRTAVAFTDATGRRWLCLPDAGSPIPVLDRSDGGALRSALDPA
ncbi:hypothetical protein Q0Z83_023160 [Actinoplanes sichuanensis]|uniref:Uncharacterized protein n=1 Tax=Actinoplanes sichuanensis TaxID=512349 RepID=A0ABW4A1D4_9ACTN|nr:hypothetical protein [Actinoplanes sichuanensis]BEL04125.1 hypothetical protein Q0Z83_023160 [Actinoplanes sichuanensis]